MCFLLHLVPRIEGWENSVIARVGRNRTALARVVVSESPLARIRPGGRTPCYRDIGKPEALTGVCIEHLPLVALRSNSGRLEIDVPANEIMLQSRAEVFSHVRIGISAAGPGSRVNLANIVSASGWNRWRARARSSRNKVSAYRRRVHSRTRKSGSSLEDSARIRYPKSRASRI